MNNGKVRIYDLSRELECENRDILAMCDRLDIAVKSHSSTIPEDDAARIRSAIAEARHSPARHRPDGKNGAGKHRRNNPRKKQEILGIKHKPRPIVEAGDRNSSSPVATPPRPPARPEPPAPSENNLAPKPVPPKPAAGADEAETPTPPTPPARPEPPQAPSRPAPPEKPAAKVEAPTLKKPPARPSESPPEVEEPEKPIAPAPPKSDSGEKPAEKPKPAAPRPPKPKRPAPPPLELKRPKPPRTEEPEEPEEEAAATTDDDDSTETVQLKRPKPPRSNKRGKKRSAEEEREEAEKAKIASKSKRRLKPMTVDDDDFEDELNDGRPDQVRVSLSIARPAQSQSAKSKSSSKPSTPSPKKKPTTGETSAPPQRRDRNRPAKPERPEIIELPGSLTVRELADLLVVPETEIVKKLFGKGIAVSITQTLDVPTAQMVADEFEVLAESPVEKAAARKGTEMLDAADLENLHRRPPVVTVMGHVDHGKTTLLDSIRKTKVAAGEAGGITQHTGAYYVDVEHEGDVQQVVFLDTPGHEAFTAMRARGARVTDIAILVVAADDGVRPQTIEAIDHAKAAEVPIVVAINKIDKEGANPDRVQQELTEHGLVPEAWGGETIMVPVSALNGNNLETLLETILLVSEVEELSANPDRPAKGTVIEAHLDKARGPVATFLVQNGTLRVGDAIVAGAVFGKVRAMFDDRGNRIEEASPSFPAEVLGLTEVPSAGDEFDAYPDEKEARSVADERSLERRESRLEQTLASRRVTLGSLSARAQEGELKELNLILKADVQGSAEAILGSLGQLPHEEVQLRVLMSAAGEVTETDIDLAAASDAVIIAFNTTLATGARQAADRQGVDVREYNIIYKLLDDIQGAMEGMLEPEMVEEAVGEAEVRAVFSIGRQGKAAGCYVRSGKLVRNGKVRVLRGGNPISEGILDSLKRMRDDVKEVNAGYECGVSLDGFNDWEEGDSIQAYRTVAKRRTLTR